MHFLTLKQYHILITGLWALNSITKSQTINLLSIISNGDSEVHCRRIQWDVHE